MESFLLDVKCCLWFRLIYFLMQNIRAHLSLTAKLVLSVLVLVLVYNLFQTNLQPTFDYND